jgi:hypothetical protein
MYVCIHETGEGFFARVRKLEDQPLTFRDPPPPLDSQIDSEIPVAKVSEAANISSTPFTTSAV